MIGVVLNEQDRGRQGHMVRPCLKNNNLSKTAQFPLFQKSRSLGAVREPASAPILYST